MIIRISDYVLDDIAQMDDEDSKIEIISEYIADNYHNLPLDPEDIATTMVLDDLSEYDTEDMDIDNILSIIDDEDEEDGIYE